MLKKKAMRAVGAMSGTSIDGVDAAELLTDGHEILEFGQTDFRPYSDDERATLSAAMGKWSAAETAEATEIVETAHAEVLSQFDGHDLIGFHGQTVAHDPANRGTHQLGDGRILAEVLQKTVVWDFRSADINLGGQGAPLAPFYHFALAKWMQAEQPICFLNLGGVGNITWIDPQHEAPENAGAIVAFDTGPANAPINDAVMSKTGLPHDAEGKLAEAGKPDQSIIETFLSGTFFSRMPPKSLDRNAFRDLTAAAIELNVEDAAATLTAAAALSAAEGLRHVPHPPAVILVTGGGRHNTTLMKMLSASMPCEVLPVEERGLNGDMLEAQAFAYLAVRVCNGLPTSCPGTTGVKAAVSGGIVSRPLSWPDKASGQLAPV